ncbi:hypothetical protein DERF_013898 [Dermatophagoides farinae]|uniref:Uncharacterized protein n=1 Tax=Dermatophagoides farinae TaxID=6954 RepID=A0A922KZ92_DERFA|nr:hypothetical protein DERF_013898 [Dermatophagoides farinae]
MVEPPKHRTTSVFSKVGVCLSPFQNELMKIKCEHFRFDPLPAVFFWFERFERTIHFVHPPLCKIQVSKNENDFIKQSILAE